MDTGYITPEGTFEPLPLFQIGPLLKGKVRELIKNDMKANYEYQTLKEHYSRFSPEVMYALVKLGYKIVAPFAKSRDNVLFSNGDALFVASKNYVFGRYYDLEKLKNIDGIPLPTDENLKFDSELTNTDHIEKGIIDELGYVDASYLDKITKSSVGQDSIDLLASFILMNDMLFSEYVYKDVLTKRKKQTDLEYLTSRPNCICIKKDNDKFNLSYISENSGKVDYFIRKLDESGLIAKYDMLELPSSDLAVQEENDLSVVDDTPKELMAK